MQNYKDFAIGLARKAEKIMRANFKMGMKKQWKEDNSPLTVTDTLINKFVIESVDQSFPDHGILGEEGSKNPDREYLWVCDPIDGTAAFSHGYPLFVFSLALVVKGVSILGVIYDPFMDRIVVGEKGKGCVLNDSPIHVVEYEKVQKGILANVETDVKFLPVMKKLNEKKAIVTKICCASYANMLVATGEMTANIYEWSKPWDAAAAKVIVEEAGGKFTDLDGKEQRYDRPINGFIASNGFIHDELVKICRNRLS